MVMALETLTNVLSGDLRIEANDEVKMIALLINILSDES